MTVHKLTAGDGYTYLTRQVAANDATERGYDNLGAYYSERGELPGVWMGRGCAAVPLFSTDTPVSEAQMLALFGQGRHPNAAAIEQQLRAAGTSERETRAATQLGNPYRIYSGANDFRQRCAVAYREHNAARGLVWNAPVPPEERARIRTEIATAMFAEEYGRAPFDARELSGHLARISRQATTAVAGYDLTFSPVKSVSALWAIAPPQIAAVIAQAHDDAVRDTLAWLEDNAAFTRIGAGGVAQVETRGLVAAGFTHRDSRSGDPDLHTHVAVSNKVQTLDGRWLALDGRPIFKNNVCASERYNTRLEALLVDRLGVRFVERAGGEPGRRAVREIVGMDGPLVRAWSSRRTALDARRADLSAQFQRDHGRPPTTVEAKVLAQQANLETRPSKHEPRSEHEQRRAWRTEAAQVLGSADAVDRLVRTALNARARRTTALTPTRAWVTATAADVIAVVSAQRATWQQNHVRAEAERQARQVGIRIGDLDAAVDAVVAEVLSARHSIALTVPDGLEEPPPLRRSDGTSVYTVAGSTLYTSPAILAAEHSILKVAGRRDGRVLDPAAVDLALLETTANGVALNPGQAHLARELVCSGARVQLALAPAGTGKTTALRTLADLWRASGGMIVGLAPSAAAAAVLRDEIGGDTDTLAKLVWHLDGQPGDSPEWLSSIDRRTLVVIDEASMAGTLELARTVEFVLGRGGSVRLVGDDQQLAAVGAGGVLRDISATHGAVSLSAVLRFVDPASGAPNHGEGAASLALRDGDVSAVAYYLDHGRVHVGDRTTCVEQAYLAWSADRAVGRDAVMLAPSRDLAGELNRRARLDRLAHAGDPGREVPLRDGTIASAGDTIITRRVKNGDRWTVQECLASGALVVTHLRSRRRLTLPADYVNEHVTLGYATTVHGAQGVTADTCHLVATGLESRQLLYVGMTRGRYANHVYLITGSDGDPHEVITRDALLPPTAAELLERIVGRDGATVSATSAGRESSDPVALLGAAALRYRHALGAAAEDVIGAETMQAIDDAASSVAVGVTGCEGYPALRAHLALLTADGHDPIDTLRKAVATTRGLGDARDAAAVLDWRLDATSIGIGPLPWVSAVPPSLATDANWGEYLRQRDAVVRQLAEHVARDARSWAPASAPAWARGLLNRNSDLVADIAVWRAARAIPDSEREPVGPPAEPAAEARAQRALRQRLAAVLGDPRSDSMRWRHAAEQVDGRVVADPYWPVLAERLTVAARAGIEVAGLVRTAGETRPLPDEQPAAALWWRIAAHLPSAGVSGGGDTLRPVWTPVLEDLVGDAAAKRLLADPAWPSLVAAVSNAGIAGWTPAQALTAAYDLLAGAQPEGEPLRDEEIATALTWRVARLTQADSEAPPPDDAEPVADATIPDPLDDDPGPVAAGTTSITNWVSDIDQTDTLLRYPGRTGVAPERLAELNELAAGFYASCYPNSWAAPYLADRLGTHLIGDDRFRIGYAPEAWDALTRHLRSLGASDEELIAAGLSVRSDRGWVRDRFRDRLMFPIASIGSDGTPEVVGFIGRRHPYRTDDDRVGPKYLNTADTDLFSKGDVIYGLTEKRAALEAGARPVLVEGPVDALAVTLAGKGAYVGVAPLGTAFTVAQARLLGPYRDNPDGPVIVATDTDVAGQRAADRAFWQLAARGHEPEYLAVPSGKDPAEMYAANGPTALRDALDAATSLADQVIDARISAVADLLQTVEGRVQATRAAAEVIAAASPTDWPARCAALAERLDVHESTVIDAVLDAAAAWGADPLAAAHRLSAMRVAKPKTRPEPAAAPVDKPPPDHVDDPPRPCPAPMGDSRRPVGSRCGTAVAAPFRGVSRR